VKRVWVVALVSSVLIVGAGCFWAGMSYGQSRASQDRESLMREQFGGEHPGGSMPSIPSQGRRGGAMEPGGGIMGTVEAIEGDTLVVSTQEGTTRVRTTETTLIEKNKSVGLEELETGEQVIISGSQNDDGSITARSIQSMRAFRLGQPSEGE